MTLILALRSLCYNKSADTSHELCVLCVYGVTTVYFYYKPTACLVSLQGTAPFTFCDLSPIRSQYANTVTIRTQAHVNRQLHVHIHKSPPTPFSPNCPPLKQLTQNNELLTPKMISITLGGKATVLLKRHSSQCTSEKMRRGREEREQRRVINCQHRITTTQPNQHGKQQTAKLLLPHVYC